MPPFEQLPMGTTMARTTIPQRTEYWSLTALAALTLGGCGSATDESPAAGSGGSAAGSASGGLIGSGGTAGGTSGGASVSTGGVPGGGSPATGGTGAASGMSSGGTPASGGAPGTGGAGGSQMAGGGSGGAPGTGGNAGTIGTGGASGGMGGAMGGMAGMAGKGGNAGGGAGGSAAGQGGSTPGDCMTPPPATPLVGWATQSGDTTGGGNATPMVVTSGQQLSQALMGSTAQVIHVSGSISGSFNIGSNKTVIGVCGAEIHGHIGISGSSNVILRNLTVVGNNCSDSPNDCSAGADAIGIGNGANHLFIDHLDISDGSDGNLDITQGSDFITVSWTKFSYSNRRTDPQAGQSGHRFSNLIGASDTDSRDPGHLNITYHHCWWADNVDQRMPRSRRGQIHLFNNLFTASGNSYCSDAGQDAKLLVQNSIYSGVNNPFSLRNNGTLRSEGNTFPGSTGNQSGSGNGFTPPYTVTLDPTDGLQAAIEAGAGPQ